jgi:1-acyl-sn-glycerol-3-phosphate acyltransferase
MKKNTIQKNSLFTKFIFYFIGKTTRILFDSIYHYFPDKEEINQPHPTLLVFNHVDHLDVPVLTSMFSFTKSNTKYTIPVRSDIMQKGFLQKEYKPRNLKKWLLKTIDFSNIIPFVFRHIGAVPIKRPFRDNSRELVKTGSFKNEIEKDWNTLAENVNMGKNLVVFPEGTITIDGDILPIKSGIYQLVNKLIAVPSINTITLTYDYLSSKKPQLHIYYNQPFLYDSTVSKEAFLMKLQKELRNGFIITPANLFSKLLFSDKFKTGISLNESKQLLIDSIHKIQLEQLKISKNLITDSADWIEPFFEKSIETGFMKKENGLLYSTELLYNRPQVKKLKKINPYMYHKNQLNFLSESIFS